MIALLLSPIVALIVWYVASHSGYDISYWQTLIYVIVAKVIAIYLKNDKDVNVTVKQSKGDE